MSSKFFLLDSQADLDYFPENRADNFTNRLNPPMQLTPNVNYSVALIEVFAYHRYRASKIKRPLVMDCNLCTSLYPTGNFLRTVLLYGDYFEPSYIIRVPMTGRYWDNFINISLRPFSNVVAENVVYPQRLQVVIEISENG